MTSAAVATDPELGRTADPIDADQPATGQVRDEVTGGQVASDLIDTDLLIEDVSIDGMCGVY